MIRTLLAILLAAPALAAPVQKAVETFPLGDVRLLDSRFKENMERNAKYLLSLDADRLLHNTRLYAGLKPKGEIYGGWESKGIAGHTLGHYLTAISQQYAATGDKRFRDRIDYIVSEMAECQKAYGDGYIGALPPRELASLRDLKKGIVNFRNSWVPWYTQHKVLAGLVDAWVLGGSAQARDVALKLADWVDDITKGLTPRQVETMLQVEHGGMLDTLVQIYALTGERRYLDASRRFYHHAIFDPLLAGRDDLTGKHANTQIPKIIGEARAYEATGNPDDRKIAEFFWDTVVHNRSWVIGGNSYGEFFFPLGKAAEHLGPATAETCNAYNMLKLTEHLFEWQPAVERADYYERALYNQILGSQEPKEGMFTYFISLEPGLFKTFSTPTNSFWCCQGTGMENHTKYGEAIYFHGPDSLYINLFIPSVLTWKEKGLVLEQRTNYPNDDTTELTIQSAPETPLTLLVRCPAWAAGAPGLQLNGRPLEIKSQPGQYAEIKRVWAKGDTLRVTIPMSLHIEKLEGNPNKIAFLYGPLVLAADLGPVKETATFPYAKDQWDNFHAFPADAPILVRAGEDNAGLAAALKRLPGQDIAFHSEGIGRPADVTLRPLNTLFYEHYNVYWDILTQQEWQDRQAVLQAEKARRQRDEARIVDELAFGEQQPEVDHNVNSNDRSMIGDYRDHKFRDLRPGGYIEARMKVLPGIPQALRCTYSGDDAGGALDILVDGKPVATQKLNRAQPGKFFDVEYPIPAALIEKKDAVTIRFQSQPRSAASRIFGLDVLKMP